MEPLHHEIIPGLFRSEFRKIAAVLCQYLGIENLDTADDIASETFLLALETWPYKGIPENPTAWLYTVAKNKALNVIKRNKLFNQSVAPGWKLRVAADEVIQPDLSVQNILDSQLQMLFAVCHPAISVESQITLALRILCGFGIDEIATAFMCNRETVTKRLQRAKQKLRDEHVQITLPEHAALLPRLDSVLTTLYLLFNEGYYSESGNTVIREEFAREAMRLLYPLVENQLTSNSKVKALFALMCFQASRFGARVDAFGSVVLYDDQDQNKWNHELIARGAYWLHEAAVGDALTTFHIEATIAYWHTTKDDDVSKWQNIFDLYNKLMQLNATPVTALNRIYAIYKVEGAASALKEAKNLNLKNNRFYYALLTELYDYDDESLARDYLEKTINLTKNTQERRALEERYAHLLARH
jgi:RNA polymerase sigma factor (sigma-70 family)